MDVEVKGGFGLQVAPDIPPSDQVTDMSQQIKDQAAGNASSLSVSC